VPIEKIGHEVVRLLRLGQNGIDPEGMGKCLEDDELRIDAGAKIPRGEELSCR
jgi:hypothetical protein